MPIHDDDELVSDTASACSRAASTVPSNATAAPAITTDDSYPHEHHQHPPPLLPLAQSPTYEPGEPGDVDDLPDDDVILHTLHHIEDTVQSLAPLVRRARPDYMEALQSDISHTMRSMLVDWLVEVGDEYSLAPQTLFLSVCYLDRFLSRVPVPRARLQLVGITCMLIASKYWEMKPPLVDDMTYISDQTYTHDEVVDMEAQILLHLDFKLCDITPHEFAHIYMQHRTMRVDDDLPFMVDMLLEMFMVHRYWVRHSSRTIAASCIFLALYTKNLPPWPTELERLVGVPLLALGPCLEDLQSVYLASVAPQMVKDARLVQTATQLRAVCNKFSKLAFNEAALRVPHTVSCMYYLQTYAAHLQRIQHEQQQLQIAAANAVVASSVSSSSSSSSAASSSSSPSSSSPSSTPGAVSHHWARAVSLQHPLQPLQQRTSDVIADAHERSAAAMYQHQQQHQHHQRSATLGTSSTQARHAVTPTTASALPEQFQWLSVQTPATELMLFQHQQQQQQLAQAQGTFQQ